MMKTVHLRLPGRSYPIYIGAKILKAACARIKPATHAFIIADDRVPEQTEELVSALSKLGWKVTTYRVTVSEGFKDFKEIYPLYGKLLEDGANRESVIFALGGGVIGDAAGFLASTYLRGIRWVGIPTTLLAQVDSALGGKTGVNHQRGKNLIGSFYQPSAVICDVTSLKTLSERDRVSGLGEMLKYGLIYDSKFFAELIKKAKKDSFSGFRCAHAGNCQVCELESPCR